MCRHLAYLGEPCTLHELLYAPAHSLERQSYAPRMSNGCILNADGFGAGWYHDGRDTPARYRRAQPMWTDVSFADVAGVIRTGCALAAVRSATPGFPVDESCAQPFRDGRVLFSHNGIIEDFGGVEAKLRDLAGDLSPVPDARAPVDSALLFAIAAGRWRAGASLAEGLAYVVGTVTALTGGRYNLLATDGRSLAATVWGDTLFLRRTDTAVLLASEPNDEEEWTRIPEHSLTTVTDTETTTTPLR